MFSDQGVPPQDDVDVVGELLFGRRLRLRVLLWVGARERAFNQSEAARGVGYNSSGEVAKELERLVELDMVRKYGRPVRVGPQNYVRLDHPGWGVVDAARELLAARRRGRPRADGAGPPLDVLDGARHGQGTGGRPS